MLPETQQKIGSESALKRRITMGLDDPDLDDAREQVDLEELIVEDVDDVMEVPQED